jgi:hypothetical protein
VVASAIVVGLGLQAGDPVIGLIITLVILRITWQSFVTVQRDPGSELDVHEGAGEDHRANGHGHDADGSSASRQHFAAGP